MRKTQNEESKKWRNWQRGIVTGCTFFKGAGEATPSVNIQSDFTFTGKYNHQCFHLIILLYNLITLILACQVRDFDRIIAAIPIK